MNNKVTDIINFYQGQNPADLIKKYGSPLYVYNERIFREHCREMKGLVSYPNFAVNYSVKANTNLALLQIARQEGLLADALSMGEIFINLRAGFKPEEILFVSNNIDDEEMRFAIDNGILMSVDSLSQLHRYGRLNPGGKIAIRFNPGVGAGHHSKVITGGDGTKFGVNIEYIEDVKRILSEYNLKLVGINQHIGSLFMDAEPYVAGIKNLLAVAKHFPGLEFIDIGGGFGVPYHKQDNEKRLNLKALSDKLSPILNGFAKEYGNTVFKIEPGRYISAESSVLLGKITSVKYNGSKKFVGTDIGFNVLARPMLYDAHHDIEIYSNRETPYLKSEAVTVVGNICESGDILAKDRVLPEAVEDDIIGILDAGAYGFAMSSNYNSRLRPAEILIRENGEIVEIRRRDTLDQLVRNMIPLF